MKKELLMDYKYKSGKEMIVDFNTIIKGALQASELTKANSELKSVNICLEKLTIDNILAFPMHIAKNVSINNPIGKLDYTMFIYRKDAKREVHAYHEFYLKDLEERPVKITLSVKVTSTGLRSDKMDEVLFKTAYEYSKSVLNDIEFPNCGKIDFRLPDNYEDITQPPKNHFDGYSKELSIN